MSVKERDYTVPAVAKAFDILEYVCTHESATLQDIVRDLSLAKTTAYQLTRTLLRRGYLRSTRSQGGYALGMRLFVLGNQTIRQLDIRAEAMPLLYELMRQVRQTCHLGVLEGNEAVYLAKVDYAGSIAVGSWMGKRFNLQSTAMGKILLAWRDPVEARTLLLSNPPASPTRNTIMDVDNYMEQLKLVRVRQWALDNEENVSGICCVAAPVFGVQGGVVAAVSITAAAEAVNRTTLSVYTKKLELITRRLSEKLGFAESGSQGGGQGC